MKIQSKTKPCSLARGFGPPARHRPMLGEGARFPFALRLPYGC